MEKIVSVQEARELRDAIIGSTPEPRTSAEARARNISKKAWIVLKREHERLLPRVAMVAFAQRHGDLEGLRTYARDLAETYQSLVEASREMRRAAALAQMDSTGGLVSVADAAKRLGVSPRRVRQLIADGRLHAERIGNMLVIPGEVLERFESLVRRPGRRSRW